MDRMGLLVGIIPTRWVLQSYRTLTLRLAYHRCNACQHAVVCPPICAFASLHLCAVVNPCLPFQQDGAWL
jgi:hypothetical protein